MSEPKTAIELLDEACRAAVRSTQTFPPSELKDSVYFMESADVMAGENGQTNWSDPHSRLIQVLSIMTFALDLGIKYERLRRESEEMG